MPLLFSTLKLQLEKPTVHQLSSAKKTTMGIIFSSTTSPSPEENSQPHNDPASSHPLLSTGSSVSAPSDTARRRLRTAAKQHAVRHPQEGDRPELYRRKTAHLRQRENRHDWYRRRSEPAKVSDAAWREGRGESDEEVSGFMRAMGGEAGVWRL